MDSQEIVTKGSKFLWNKGIRILQGNRLGKTDEAHVEELARYMDLNGEGEIADMGCGFGEVSRLLAPKSQGAVFWLVNNNEFQMQKCLELDGPFSVVFKDMCRTELPENLMDLAMFNYSLCLVDHVAALKEAARISQCDGRLFVYDYERTGGDNRLTQKVLFANFLSDNEFRLSCLEAGWNRIETIHPGGDDALFREAVDDDPLYDEMFKDLQPVIWKAYGTAG